MDVINLLLLQELLFIGEDLPEEVLVHLSGWWKVILHCNGVREKNGDTYGAYQGM